MLLVAYLVVLVMHGHTNIKSDYVLCKTIFLNSILITHNGDESPSDWLISFSSCYKVTTVYMHLRQCLVNTIATRLIATE